MSNIKIWDLKIRNGIMKNILGLTIFLFLLGCGESNGAKYPVIDDGNGTQSPRISKVLIHYDGNTTERKTILYSYNKENMLIKKLDKYKTSDVFEGYISYTYNEKKQIKTIVRRMDLFIGSHSEFLYGEVLYVKTKLPMVSSSKYEGSVHGHGRVLQIDYEYEYSDNGEIRQLKSSQYILTESTSAGDHLSLGTIIKSAQYIYDKNEKIIQKNGDDYTYKYTYNTFGKLSHVITSQGTIEYIYKEYIYNKKHLLISSKEYDYNQKLRETKTYIYENKPYYLNSSPNYLDQGQYSSSGIY